MLSFDRDAIADTLRRLRPRIRAWLERDLVPETGIEATRAYADLTLAFGFARLGMKSDAEQLIAEATSIFSSLAYESHDQLLRLYQYRVDAALRADRVGGLLPVHLRPLDPDEAGFGSASENPELIRQNYHADVLRSFSRVLDPERCVDPYAGWTRNQNSQQSEIAQLSALDKEAEIESRARQFLTRADRMEFEPRITCWARTFAILRRGCPDYATKLIFEIPDLLRATRAQLKNVPARRAVRTLFQYAVEHVAGLYGSEPFPPLVEAGIGLVEDARDHGEPGESSAAIAQIVWPCLQWFRKLDSEYETAMFLHRTGDLWTSALAPSTRRGEFRSDFYVRAPRLARLACQAYTGNSNELPAALQAELDIFAQTNRSRFDDDYLSVINFARVAGLLQPSAALDYLTTLLTAIPSLPNRFTMAAHYSRFHFQIVEAIVLSFPAVGDF